MNVFIEKIYECIYLQKNLYILFNLNFCLLKINPLFIAIFDQNTHILYCLSLHL